MLFSVKISFPLYTSHDVIQHKDYTLLVSSLTIIGKNIGNEESKNQRCAEVGAYGQKLVHVGGGWYQWAEVGVYRRKLVPIGGSWRV